uniref:SRCR domain-containing protein n=1 Tax=Gadus morhua TaxID=8049 RepID=A0A8C5AUJ0_GADMO
MQKSVVSSLTICFVSLLVSQIRTRYLCESESKIRSPEEGAIRLAGSKTRSQGRVEVYLHGKWGTVCHNAWDLPDAQVVCRQLHFKGAVSAAAGGTFGEGTGQIWLDQTKCVGTENSLSNCSYNGWGLIDCSHKDDAGVICVAGTSATETFVDHSLELSEDLGQLFDSEEGCDFLIHGYTYTGENRDDGLWEMVDTTVCAHRMILSRFPGLTAPHDSDDRNDSVWSPIPQVTIVESALCTIRYVYTRKLEVSRTTAECIHQLASHFGMRRLMEDAGRLFTKLLPEDRSFLTQVSFYEYSVEAGDRVLQENCLQYMAWNFQKLSTSKAWSSVSAELLQALLSRSDLVVPGETFVLAALEDWVSQVNRTTSEEQQAALLARVRFPMIPAKELIKLRYTSALYSVHPTLYQEKVLKGFQAHSLPFGTLKNSSNFQADDRDYQARIYTAPPWSVAYDQSNTQYYKKPSLRTTEHHSTPVHTSAVFNDRKVDWQLNLFNEQSDCSSRGLLCDSLPAARMRMSTHKYQDQGQGSIRYSNRLLLSCRGRFIFHIVDFKEDFAYVPAGASVTYPCPNEGYIYHFVVRPEYI